MKKLILLFAQEEVFIVVVTVAILGLSLAPLVYEITSLPQIPPDRVFTLDHNFLPDYNTYLSKMRQGAEGGWLVYERMTSEPHKGSLIQTFYLYLGKLGALFGLSVPITYLAARIILGATWFFASYLFIRRTVEKPELRKIAFLFLAFSGGIIVRVLRKEWVWELGLVGWSQLDVVKRATFVPHFLAGHILFLVAVLFFYRFQKKPSKLGVVLAGPLAFLTGLVLPQMVLLAVPVIFAMLVVSRKNFWQQLPFLAAYAFGSLAVLVYFWKVTQVYPWKALPEGDVYLALPFPFLAYFQALGATFILAILGAALVLWQKKLRAYPALFWAATALGLLFAADRFVGFNQRRFIDVGVELPLSILSAIFLGFLARKIWARRERLVLAALAGIILVPGMITNYVSLRGQIQFTWERVHATWPLVPINPYVIYPVKDWMEAIWWLRDNTENSEIVLAEDTAGNFIPAHAGNAVYIGHGGQTVKYREKRPLAQKFFSGQMSVSEARRFLESENISYVFWGVEERELGDFVTRLPFLTSVFEGLNVTLFRVNL